MNANVAPMGQLFRLKSTDVIPTNFSVQSKAILTALKQYGMYLSDIGTNFYILGPVMARPGWNVNSAAVPP